jgi:deoxyribonuclease V
MAIQRALRDDVVECALPRTTRLVAGADLAFSPDGRRCIAGIVVWDRVDAGVVEEVTAVRPARFPYIPGLLSFREAPALLAAARKLEHVPDAWIFDGQGRAHPRRFGLACHVGVLLNQPTIGCAKSRLCGKHTEPSIRRGACVGLYENGDRIGSVLRTRDGVKAVYVSVGHRVTLAEAVKLVAGCCTKYRLPEPTRLADQLVSRRRRNV